ncbi:MAG: Plasmid stabilization system [Parcubacteria group bacterium GW2011_GWC2_45_7]|nr:MAG: Plasmid stabilization system [Parcubacteria group bacterium GW2011_GWC2_45_7]KKU73176.1 MAG: Plasmid stabilization system [Parcubacteria group bacterium GW2011_GWA2_47_26]
MFYTSRFAREAKRVPRNLRGAVEERVEIFRRDSFDPRLKTHKLTGALKGFWSFYIDYRYRVIFEFIKADRVLFHSIGDHSIYDEF